MKSRIQTFPVHFLCWWSWTARFCMDKSIFRKERLFCNLGARWHKILQFVPSVPIYGWLAWWCDFFPVGPTCEDHPQIFRQKKVQPLGFNFCHLHLGLLKSLFWLVKLNICVCTRLQGQLYFQQKNKCFAIRARVDTKFLNLSHHMLSMDDRSGDATFFLWGQPLKIIHKNSDKKKSLGFYFWHLRLGLFKPPFLVGEAEHMWLYPFARTNEFSANKYVFCNLGARWHEILEFVPLVPIYGWLAWWCDFSPVGPTCEDHPQIFRQKKVQPLGFNFCHLHLGLLKSLFLVGEAEHMCLYCLYPFAKSCKEPYPPQTIMGHFSWGFDVHICSSELPSPPMKIIFLWPDVCTPQENNFELFWTKTIFLSSNGRMG